MVIRGVHPWFRQVWEASLQVAVLTRLALVYTDLHRLDTGYHYGLIWVGPEF